MKHWPKFLLVIVMLAALPLASGAGCNGGIFGTPTTRPALSDLGKVDELRADYTVALRSANDLIEAKVIKDPDAIAVVGEIRDRAPKELDAAEQHARAGNAFNFDYFYGRARASVLALNAERQRRGVK
jgi:hypothetical protein